MQRLIAEAQSLGCQIIAVIATADDNASVRRMRRSAFAIRAGRGSGYKHGRWLDTVFTQLALNGGATSSRINITAGTAISHILTGRRV